jgi:hypothetical protein
MGTDGLYGMTVHRPRQTDVKRSIRLFDPSHNVESS